MSKWLNLSSKTFTEELGRWYNLSTNRYVKKSPQNREIKWSLRGIRVLGTFIQIQSFHELNSSHSKYPRGEFEDLAYKPFEDINFLSLDICTQTDLCLKGPVQQHLTPPQSSDVEKLTSEQLEGLSRLNFGGLFLKARVKEVIDGDTLVVVVFVPLSELGMARTAGKKVQANIYPLNKSSRTGFFTTLHIRTFGYDAVEKKHSNGKLATQLFTEKINSLGNIIWCQFVDVNLYMDKYDRHLAVLFEDEKKTKLLNDFLFRKEKELNVRLVNPYLGEKKKDF